MSPFPWRGLPSSQLLWEFVVLALEETALYLKATFLCRRFCRFIEPLLQSWPLGPFISYRTFYLRFMEHAIRPDIPTVAQYWDLTNNLVLFFEQLMSQKKTNLKSETWPQLLSQEKGRRIALFSEIEPYWGRNETKKRTKTLNNKKILKENISSLMPLSSSLLFLISHLSKH